MVRISPAAMAAMREHAEAGYPFEICGFLVGGASGNGRAVAEAWPVRNAWEDDPEARSRMFAEMAEAGGNASAGEWESATARRRFLVAPQDVVAAMKRARGAGLDLVGIYHTHPEHPAQPSAFDRDAAWPEWSYVILSVREGRVAEVRSWVVEGEDGPFIEEEIAGSG
ncbi:MAG TPA: M67 family metallopeptidase [Armatimonadota bacterium]|nr:M67 family metallopeptidase [Armatimonadota bacterium]